MGLGLALEPGVELLGDEDVGGDGADVVVNHALKILVVGDGDEGTTVAGEEVLDRHGAGIGIPVEHAAEFQKKIGESCVTGNLQGVSFSPSIRQGAVSLGNELSSRLADG